MSADLMTDRMPPQSREAEMGVLGSVLRDNQVINDLLNVITADNFYFDAHQKLFQAIIDIYNDGKPVDLTILFETLKQRDARVSRDRELLEPLGQGRAQASAGFSDAP